MTQRSYASSQLSINKTIDHHHQNAGAERFTMILCSLNFSFNYFYLYRALLCSFRLNQRQIRMVLMLEIFGCAGEGGRGEGEKGSPEKGIDKNFNSDLLIT